MLCGLLRPDGGGGTCLGFDLLREPMRIRREVGYMTQRFSFYGDLTVRENLEFVARLYEMPQRDRGDRRRDAAHGADARAPASLRRNCPAAGSSVSRSPPACCTARRLLLLDEPTAGVDAKARREFWDMIHDMAADGMTVLVSTHYMDEAERCQRVVYLVGGKLVVQGTVPEVVASARPGGVRGDRPRHRDRRAAHARQAGRGDRGGVRHRAARGRQGSRRAACGARSPALANGRKCRRGWMTCSSTC